MRIASTTVGYGTRCSVTRRLFYASLFVAGMTIRTARSPNFRRNVSAHASAPLFRRRAIVNAGRRPLPGPMG